MIEKVEHLEKVLSVEMLRNIRDLNLKKYDTLRKVLNQITKITGQEPETIRHRKIGDYGWGMRIDEYFFSVSPTEQIRITTEYETEVMLIEVYEGKERKVLNQTSDHR